MDRILLPPKARALLAELVRQREELATRLDLAVATIRAALDVPDDYVLRNLDEGFVPPEEPPEEGG